MFWVETLFMWVHLLVNHALMWLHLCVTLYLINVTVIVPVSAGEHWPDNPQPGGLHSPTLCLRPLSYSYLTEPQHSYSLMFIRCYLLQLQCACVACKVIPCEWCTIKRKLRDLSLHEDLLFKLCKQRSCLFIAMQIHKRSIDSFLKVVLETLCWWYCGGAVTSSNAVKRITILPSEVIIQ